MKPSIVRLLIAGVFLAGIASFAAFPPRLPDPSLKPELVIKATPGQTTYKAQKPQKDQRDFVVIVPQGYDPKKAYPTVFSSHGNGGNGPGEAGPWQGMADQNGWIVVCPHFRSAVIATDVNLNDDEEMLKEIVDRVFKSLNVDRKNVMFTGFSGGGSVTWHVATRFTGVFTALCPRSGNFWVGERVPRHAHWKNIPLYTFWGEKDTDGILKDKAKALLFIDKQLKPKTWKNEIIPGGGHDSQPEKAAAWFSELIQKGSKPTSLLDR